MIAIKPQMSIIEEITKYKIGIESKCFIIMNSFMAILRYNNSFHIYLEHYTRVFHISGTLMQTELLIYYRNAI